MPDIAASFGIRPLSASEEAALARRRDAGDHSARDVLWTANLPLAYWWAARYARGRQPADVEDIRGSAVAGVGKAADRYDPAFGRRFGEFAADVIRREIVRGYFYRRSLIAVPPSARAKERYAREVAAADAFRPQGGPGPVALSALPARDGSRPFDEDEIAVTLATVARLDARSAAIVRAYYGTCGEAPADHRTIAEGLGLTGERVRQIRVAAIVRLRGLTRLAPETRVAEHRPAISP